MNFFTKTIILFSVCLLLMNLTLAQDIIVTNDAKSIKAKVLEISEFDIKYKDFDNLDGPSYTIKKSKIQTIIYQNGKVESFTAIEVELEQNDKPKLEAENVADNIPYKTYEEFLLMNDLEKENYFLNTHLDDMYNTFRQGCKMQKTGNGLFYSGLGLSIVGFSLTLAGIICYSLNESGYYDYYDYYNDDYYYSYYYDELEGAGVILLSVGAPLFAVGSALLISGIPLKIKGKNKKYEAENMYRDFIGAHNSQSYHPTLNWGITPNGVGLVLRF